MHNIENAEPLSPKPRSMAEIRQAIGQSWPGNMDAEWEAKSLHGSLYTMSAAPKGAESYTAKSLGLTK